MKITSSKPDNTNLENYLAIIAIVPAVFGIMAYELVDYSLYILRPERVDYDPLVGLGVLIPMALMMELFTFFISRHLLKKFSRLSDAIIKVANGDYSVSLDEKRLAPLTKVVRNFNDMTLQLQSVETLRSDFISEFSHEFKTPIVSINGFAQLLLDESLPEAERREYLGIIASESERLSFLAEQTMLLSKLDTQVRIPEKEAYSLSEQLKQDIILLSNEWSSKNISVHTDVKDISYIGNKSLMNHIWINLISNAVKFTPEKGTIDITASELKDDIFISVRDSGIGMTQVQMNHIFDRFYQAEQNHSIRGLGLGLTIAGKIVSLCQGSIEIDSTPGKGSCFTVTLPKETRI